MTRFRADRLRLHQTTSYQALADAIGVSKKAVSDWMTGKADPEAESLVRLADYLNVSVDYLLGRVEVPTMIVNEFPARLHPFVEALMVYDTDEIETLLRALLVLRKPRAVAGRRRQAREEERGGLDSHGILEVDDEWG